MNVQTCDHVEALQAAMNRFWELRALVVGARELLIHGDGEDKRICGFTLLESAARLAEEYGGEAWEAWEPSGDIAPGSIAPETEHPEEPGDGRVRYLSGVPHAQPKQETKEGE